jgi:restriction system protein
VTTALTATGRRAAREDARMSSAWIIRVGQASRRAAAFQNPAAIALGWAEVPGLADLTGLDFDTVTALTRRAAGAGEPARDAAQLLAFRDEVAVGDLVVAPDAVSGDVLVGSVTGDYTYDTGLSEYYPHRRTATWQGRVRSADIPAVLEPDTRGNVTLRAADGSADEWRALAQAAAPVQPRARRTRQARAPRATTTTPKQPVAKKASAKAKTPAPDRRCPGCGYSWPASQFAGGDLCVECRG